MNRDNRHASGENTQKTNKVAVFPGSFDPIHPGHIGIIQKCKALGYDRLLLLIEPKPRRKTNLAALGQRARIARQVLNDFDLNGFTKVNGINPDPNGQFSLSHTLPLIESKYHDADIALVMGSDLYAHLPNWGGIDKYRSRFNALVFRRPGSDLEPKQASLPDVQFISQISGISSSTVKANLSPRALAKIGYSHAAIELLKVYKNSTNMRPTVAIKPGQ